MESEKLIPMRLGLSTDLAPKPSHQGAPDMDFIINTAGISTITNPDEDSAIFNLDMKSLSIYPVSCTLYMTQAFATVCSVLRANSGSLCEREGDRFSRSANVHRFGAASVHERSA